MLSVRYLLSASCVLFAVSTYNSASGTYHHQQLHSFDFDGNTFGIADAPFSDGCECKHMLCSCCSKLQMSCGLGQLQYGTPENCIKFSFLAGNLICNIKGFLNHFSMFNFGCDGQSPVNGLNPRPPQGSPFDIFKPQYGNPKPPYGDPQSPYGDAQYPYGDLQNPYGNHKPPYGKPKPPYGDAQLPYGDLQSPNANPQSPNSDPTGSLNDPIYNPMSPVNNPNPQCDHTPPPNTQPPCDTPEPTTQTPGCEHTQAAFNPVHPVYVPTQPPYNPVHPVYVPTQPPYNPVHPQHIPTDAPYSAEAPVYVHTIPLPTTTVQPPCDDYSELVPVTEPPYNPGDCHICKHKGRGAQSRSQIDKLIDEREHQQVYDRTIRHGSSFRSGEKVEPLCYTPPDKSLKDVKVCIHFNESVVDGEMQICGRMEVGKVGKPPSTHEDLGCLRPDSKTGKIVITEPNNASGAKEAKGKKKEEKARPEKVEIRAEEHKAHEAVMKARRLGAVRERQREDSNELREERQREDSNELREERQREDSNELREERQREDSNELREERMREKAKREGI